MKIDKGIFPVLQAPFTRDGTDIDLEDLSRETDAVISDGANGMVLFGYSTEFMHLSVPECDRMLRVVVDTCAGRIPVIPSVTRTTPAEAVDDAAKYADAGADAVMILPLFREDFVKTIQAVARRVGEKLPIMVQYAPQNNGIELPFGDFAKIRESIPNHFSVKAEPQPAGPYIEEFIRETQGRIPIYTGWAGVTMYEALERGAAGIMPSASFVAVYVKFYREFSEGSKEKAFELYTKVLPYIYMYMGRFGARDKQLFVRRGIFKTDIYRPYPPENKNPIDPYNDAAMWKYFEQLKALFPKEIPW